MKAGEITQSARIVVLERRSALQIKGGEVPASIPAFHSAIRTGGMAFAKASGTPLRARKSRSKSVQDARSGRIAGTNLSAETSKVESIGGGSGALWKVVRLGGER